MMGCILTSSNALDSLTTPIEIGAGEARDYDSLFSLRHRAVALFENLVSQFCFTSWSNYSTPRVNTKYVIYKLDQPSEIRTLGIYKVCADEIRTHKKRLS